METKGVLLLLLLCVASTGGQQGNLVDCLAISQLVDCYKYAYW